MDVVGNENQAEGVNTSIALLNDVWRTEANAPEILNYNSYLVDSIRELLSKQQEIIDDKTDEANVKEHFTITIYQMDIERVRYSLSRYLRTRMLKIEKNLEFINENMSMRNRLSYEEQQFADSLLSLNNQFFVDNVKDKLQDNTIGYLESSDDRIVNAQPKLQEFVFCKATEDIINQQISSDQYMDVREGDVNILQYFRVQNAVLDGKMHLL